jgi:3-methyladenine DNA glycosylase AlkD
MNNINQGKAENQLITLESAKLQLKSLSTNTLSAFTSSLIPGSKPVMGVKVPLVRKLAKTIAKQPNWEDFANCTSFETYEEQLLCGLVIGYAKAPLQDILDKAAVFIGTISDWAVNDGFCTTFTIAKNNREAVKEWLESFIEQNTEFSQRVVAVLLMDHFLVPEYIDYVLQTMNRLTNEGYYTKMAVAWTIASAYAKFPIETGAYLENAPIADWTYNKAIQKMKESFRVSEKDKAYWTKKKRKN